MTFLTVGARLSHSERVCRPLPAWPSDGARVRARPEAVAGRCSDHLFPALLVPDHTHALHVWQDDGSGIGVRHEPRDQNCARLRLAVILDEVRLMGRNEDEAAGRRHLVDLHFEIDPFRKDCLYRGLDSIGLTLQHEAAIAAYEAKRRTEAPWLFTDLRHN